MRADCRSTLMRAPCTCLDVYGVLVGLTHVADDHVGRGLQAASVWCHRRWSNPPAPLHRPLSVCRVHTPAGEIPTQTRVGVLAFSPACASHIVSSGAPDTHISLWDAETAAEVRQFRDHSQRVWSLAFSQKQPAVFASGSDDCTMRLWAAEQQRSTLTINFDTNVCCVAACPWDANMFAAGTAGHSMAVYDVRYPGTPVSSLTGAHMWRNGASHGSGFWGMHIQT